MRKLKTIFTITLAAFAMLFISCKNSNVDENGCYIDIDEAIKAAENKKQDLMLIFSVEIEDSASKDFLNNVVRTPEFKKEIASKFAVVCMDFSKDTYEATVAKEDATDAEKKIAEKKSEILNKNIKMATMLDIQETPCVYLLSPEKYLITGIFYDDEKRTFEGFKTLLDSKEDQIKELHNMIYQTKIGTPEEKVASIDALYETTSPDYRFMLYDLISSVKKLDPTNKTGLLGKYIYAAADSKSHLCVIDGDVNGAIQAFLDIESEESVPADKRQQLMYTAAYMAASSGTWETPEVVKYLEKSINIAPDSEMVPAIRRVIEALSAEAK